MDIAGIIAAGGVESRFQPIVELEHGVVIAHEALSRGPASSDAECPRSLFAHAARQGCERLLDAACRQMALRRAVDAGWEAGADGPLFLNVRAGSLAAPGFLSELQGAVAGVGRLPRDIVLEISEAEQVGGNPPLQSRLAECRAAGFWIALDDAGAGHCGLQAIAEVVPHVVKVDRALVGGMDVHRGRRIAVSALVHLARELGILLIAEGIETEGELRVARELGIALGQGYLLGRPGEALLPAGSVVAAVARSATASGRVSPPAAGLTPSVRVRPIHPRAGLALAS